MRSNNSGLNIDSGGNVWVTNRFGSGLLGMAHMIDMAVHLKAKGVTSASDYLTTIMSEQRGGSGSVTLLRPDGTQFPGSPFTAGGLPGPWAVVVDGNDNVWVSNFNSASSPITQLCGVKTENCPPGFKTGDQIAPKDGYVGGGLQMQTDLAIDPAGNVWVMNNWQDIDSCIGTPPEAHRLAVAVRVSSFSMDWRSQSVRRKLDQQWRLSRSNIFGFGFFILGDPRQHTT